MTPLRLAASAAFVALACSACNANGPHDSPVAAAASGEWSIYSGTSAANRYSSLTQIDRSNVRNLKPAWRFDSDEPGDPQTNPLIIDGTLFAYTPALKVVALNAATGVLLWKFDSGITGSGPQRGLTYWTDGGRERRLFASVMNFLYALDPASGKPIESFGERGRIDLRQGLRGDYTQHSVSLTSPGVICKDLIIVGFRTGEAQPAPPGDIRAYDARSGALRWSFHTIPHPGEFGHDSWSRDSWLNAGAANNWAGMTVDQSRGIVYVPTGSAASDFYGADRVGDNLFANSLLALDAATGKRLWHFQFVHHDIWDRDPPAQPVLLTVKRDGRTIDAVAQTTKQGFVFVFDRVTGAPLFPIEERAYPPSTVPGEVTAPTQPLPLLPEPFARQRLTEQMLTTRTEAAHAWAVEQFRSMRSDGQFLPFSLERPTILFPGFDGGAEWGGPAVNPATGVMYVNANDLAWTGMLAEQTAAGNTGAGIYEERCSVCHGADRKGSPPAFPSLVDIAGRLSAEQIAHVIRTGSGRMPAFPSLEGEAFDALLDFLRTGEDAKTEAPSAPVATSQKYRFTGYHKFLDPDGYPAVAPPWGTLSAIDLNTGNTLWKIPLGEYPELAAQGLKNTGTENYGGPILTASGVLFIGATIFDRKLRAFDSSNSELLWETELPFAGTATPATYMIDGKQYVVIFTSNAKNRKAPQGSAYVAFSLP